MRAVKSAVLVGFLLAAGRSESQELSAANLSKLKDATVYVKHAVRGGYSTGSGFLFKKSGGFGYILTCEHVVSGASEVEVVFGSGDAKERVLKAAVVATDADRDLACLRIKDETLPVALELGAKTEVRETENVYGSGFPFGDMLATSAKNPNISVTKVTVSSIRKGDGGEVVVVQLSGDLNPGNSGGPVMDSKGRVVGVTAAKIRGTQTAFAIPPEEIKAFTKGRIKGVAFDVVSGDATRLKLKITVGLIDPLASIKSVSWAWIRHDLAKGALDSGSEGKFKLANPGMKIASLKVDAAKGEASGTVDFTRAAADPIEWDVVFQCGAVTADQVTTWTQEGTHRLEFTGTAVAEKPKEEAVGPAADKTLKTGDELTEAARLQLRGVVPDMFLSKDGAWLYVLDAADGLLLKLTAATLEKSATVDVGDEAVAMCMNGRGDTLYVVSRTRQGTQYDDEGRGRVRAYAASDLKPGAHRDFMGDPVDVEVTNGGMVLVSIVEQFNGLVVTDMSGKVSESTVHSINGFSVIHLHPDQTRLYTGKVGGSPTDHCCVTLAADAKSKQLPVWDSPYHGDYPMGGEFAITPDGKFLWSSAGTVFRLGKTRETDMVFANKTEAWISCAMAPAYSTAFLGTSEGFVKQVKIGSFELEKSFQASGIPVKLALDSAKKRLYAFVIPREGLAKHAGPRIYGCGDVLAWSLESK